jgi:hypothetical protein
MVRLVVFIWLVVAATASAAGVLRRLPVPPPVIGIGLTIAVLLVVRLSAGTRAAVHRVGPGPLVVFHLSRIAAGAYFLVMGARGVLPREFTTPAGWGDIVVGVAAIGILLQCLPIRTAWQRVAFMAWNVAGLLDILGVVGNAMRLFIQDPSFADPFRSLPLAILPTFVVPIVIVSHVLLFSWVRLKPDTTRRV